VVKHIALWSFHVYSVHIMFYKLMCMSLAVTNYQLSSS